MADEKEQGAEFPSFVWKEPINGKSAFFTEEVYRQLAGPEPTVEERVTKLMDELGFPPPSKESHRRKSSDWSNNLTNSEDSSANSSHELSETPKKQETTASSQGQLSSESEEKGASDVDKKDNYVSSGKLPTIPTTSTLSQENQHSIEQADQKDVLENATTGNSAAPQNDQGAAPQADKVETVATSNSASTSDLDKKLPGTNITNMKDVPSKPLVQSDVGFLSADKTGLQAKNMGKDGVGANGGNTKKMAKYQAKGQNKGKSHVFTRPALPEPPKSSLTHDQHVRYLHLFQKCVQRYCSGLATPQSEHEINELREFQTLQLLVAKEQEECQSHLKQVSMLNPHLYTSMPAHVTQYTQDKEKNSWQRAETYCRYYNNNTGQLPLAVNIPCPPLQLVRTLVEVGSKCKLVVPDLNPHHMNRQKPTVLTDGQKIVSRFPTIQSGSQSLWHHEPASKDSNLEILVRKHPCQIATSASVLQQLVDNHGPEFSAAWDIPVIIKEYGQGAGSRKVVFLDKPLRPSVLSLCQKKTQYLQKAVRAFLCHPQNERKLVAGRGRNSRDQTQSESTNSATGAAAQSRAAMVKSDDEEDPFGSVNMEDLETFGSDKMFSSSSKKIPDIKLSFVKGSVSEARPQTSESSVSDSSIISGSGAGKIGHQNENSVLENVVMSESRSDTTQVKAQDNPDAKQNTDKTCTGSETHSRLENQLLSPESCSGQLETYDNDLSTDDEGALIIADQGTPVKASDTPTSSSHHMLRRSQDSKTSIFDDVSVPETPAHAKSPVCGQTDELPARRITRSASLKLSSPEVNSGKSSTSSFNQSSVSSENTSTDFSETVSGASAMASPRLTRQSSKRKVSECSVSAQEHEVVNTAADESLCLKKRRQISQDEAASTANETTVSSSSGPEERAEVAKTAVSSTPSTPDKQSKKNGQQNTETSTYFDSILKEISSGKDPGQQWQEDPSQYKQPGCVGEHVGYHLWDLGGTSIVIRCNSHSFIRDMRQQQKAVYVRAKPERQLPHGLEQNTLSECVRSWLGCYLRPNSYLLRARVNMQNYELVQADELQLNQILQPTLNFSPPCAFAVLQNMFAKLMDLPVGSYLLSHEPGANYVSLKTGTGAKRGGYDLRSHYMSLVMQEADTGVPWVPVDPTLMLPNHWRMGLIPVTFQPPDFDPKRKKQQHVPPKKKHRNRRKKQN